VTLDDHDAFAVIKNVPLQRLAARVADTLGRRVIGSPAWPQVRSYMRVLTGATAGRRARVIGWR
jgi:hypothetical protein